VELKSGEIYRGELHDAEDNWNVQLTNVQATARDGKVRRVMLPLVSTACLPLLAAQWICCRKDGCCTADLLLLQLRPAVCRQASPFRWHGCHRLALPAGRSAYN